MDIHHSEKHGPFARLYFITAILVIVLGSAFILRMTDFLQEKNTVVKPTINITSNIEDPTIDIKSEVKTLTTSSRTIENKIVTAKQLTWLEAKPIYNEQISNFKLTYTSLANIINFAKNKNINTVEIEKNFDDLKNNISLAETSIQTAKVEDVQKYLDLSLTNLNTIIGLVGNL